MKESKYTDNISILILVNNIATEKINSIINFMYSKDYYYYYYHPPPTPTNKQPKPTMVDREHVEEGFIGHLFRRHL